MTFVISFYNIHQCVEIAKKKENICQNVHYFSTCACFHAEVCFIQSQCHSVFNHVFSVYDEMCCCVKMSPPFCYAASVTRLVLGIIIEALGVYLSLTETF